MANKLVARLCLLFGEPDTHDVKAWFAEMDRMLSPFSEVVLDRAADVVLRTYRGKSFPPVAVMMTACEEARNAMIERPKPDPGYHEWSKERIAKADKLIACSMGQRAAREGWISALHSFARENERLPNNQTEIARCKRVASDFDSAFSDCVSGRGGLVGSALQRLGTSMLERRDALSAKANVEIA